MDDTLSATSTIETTTTGRRAKRLTQRQPLVCRACTKSKVRCDKTIPCARCRKRRIPCEREEVELSSKRQKTAHVQEDLVCSGDDDPRPLSAQGISRDIGKRTHTAEVTVSVDSNLQGSAVPRTPNSARKSPSNRHPQAAFEDLATGIEGLAWGRHQCFRYPHRDCLQIETSRATTSGSAISPELLEQLPNIFTARKLVTFHIRWLAWNHNVLHVPTFLQQCENFWALATIEDGQWLALYCAVLSSSCWSIQNMPNHVDEIDVVNFAPSARILFDMMLVILNNEQFMRRHTAYSIQAVCISGMVGNVFGESDLLTTLVNASVRIAQCLGLHRIPGKEAEESWDDTIEKEVGRRMWWKLVEMDFHSTPYTGSCSINARHFTTKLPLNCNDEDLLDQDESHLTTSTYSIIMAKMSLCIPTLLDGIYASGDLTSRYEHVISVDRQMRSVVTKIPSAILRDHGMPSTEPEWLNLARRTLSITAADKILMIHRSFLLKSFQSPAYLFTRTTCISAAMTILREHEQLYEAQKAECPPIWVHSAFCVTAIVVICLNLLHCRTSMTLERREHFERLIRSARTRLSLSKSDTMARRGVFLIDAMLDDDLPDPDTTAPTQASGDGTQIEFVRILHRFLQQDQHETHTRASLLNPLEFESGVLTQLDDFDTWYLQMFG